MTAIGAYNVGPVPVSWLAQSGYIALAVGVILFTNRFRPFPGAVFLFVFLGWAFFVTTVHLGEFSGMMPRNSTSPYWAYVTFRYIGFISFISALYLTYWLVGEGEGEAVVRWLSIIACVIALVALYIYLAHMFGLPELTRNRLGTGGSAQATQFSIGGFFYNRATGTFREPSGLAEWLMLPFFLSFGFRGRMGRFRSAIIGGTIALTLSMMALFSLVAGTLVALLLTRPFSKRTYKVVGLTIVLVAIVYFLLMGITVGLVGGNQISLGSLVGDRVLSTLIGGIGRSNRSYIYDFVATNPFPPMGMGMGNGNLKFTQVLGVDSPAAFLSIYLFTLYSAGYPGMLLIGAFLVRPIFQYVWSFKRTIGATPLVLMAYLGYLVSSSVGAEEMSPWLGITAALFACEAQRLAFVRKAFSRSLGVFRKLPDEAGKRLKENVVMIAQPNTPQ